MEISDCFKYDEVISAICDLNWGGISETEMMDVATAYYYFSIQFRENLLIARRLYPDDNKLIELEAGECNTDNLSPWPGVALDGERLDHDEFMSRLLDLSPLNEHRRKELDGLGQAYLTAIRRFTPQTRARSIASYEDRGLEKVFTAMLTFNRWNNASLQAFKHFLLGHLEFDADPDHGHGALARHLGMDDDVLPLWSEFRRILVVAAPGLQK